VKIISAYGEVLGLLRCACARAKIGSRRSGSDILREDSRVCLCKEGLSQEGQAESGEECRSHDATF
jgi:hypothetical protein